MASGIYKEFPATHWCFSWWHKIRFGSSEKITDINKHITNQEYFCKKCKRKTGGFTHIKFDLIIKLTLPSL